MPLTDLQIRNAKPTAKSRKLTDANGLYLTVMPSGRKVWRYDCRWLNKRLTLTFGVWPKVGISEARKKRDDARGLLDKGKDPRPKRSRGGDSFKEVAERWIDSRPWKNTTKTRVRNRLEQNLYPDLGARVIGDIEATELLEVLRKVEARGVGETVHRCREYASRIFRFGIPEGVCKRDTAADLRGPDALRPKPKTRNNPKIPATGLGPFLRKLDDGDEEQDTRDALRLTLLTVARTSEIRFAHVDELEGLDSAEPIWRLSPERMKMENEHLVPLSRQAAAIFKRRAKGVGRSGLLFAAPTRSGVISENTMLYALYRMGYHSRATVHGLRGTFSTIANESEDPQWHPDWVEMAMAHQIGGVRGVYNAALYLPQRRRLLQWWADYLDEARIRTTRPHQEG